MGTADTNKLTEEQKKLYIESEYSKCPRCKSTELDGGFVEVDGKHCWQTVFCHECNLEWNDIYNLSNVEVTSE